jgi:HK97 family phage major capsid protein
MKDLLEKRAEAFKKADAIANLVKSENRSMTEDELTNINALHKEIEDLDVQIETLKKQEALRAAQAMPVQTHLPPQSKDEKNVIRSYSLLKALRSVVDPNIRLSGAELEMDQEARKEQREARIDNLVTGAGVNIPSMAIRANEQVVDPAEQGGHTVATNLVEVISILKPQTVLRDAGARMMSGLVGDLDFTNQDSRVNTNWKTEIATLDQGAQTFAKRGMKPHRLGAWVPISMQLLAQSSIDMENFVRDDMSNAIAESLELAAFSGTGVDPVPEGMLGQITTLPIGTNGGKLTYDFLVDMETQINKTYARGGKMAYMINSVTKGQLKKERTDAGSGLFTWAQNSDLLNGYRALVGDLLPANGSKGTGTNLSSAIFGNWDDLLIGNWGGLNMILDPYTKAKEGQHVIVANTFWDVFVRRLESFVAIVDIDTSL